MKEIESTIAVPCKAKSVGEIGSTTVRERSIPVKKPLVLKLKASSEPQIIIWL